MGTGGTITGVARYLKQMNPKIQIVGVDPVGSILYDAFYTGKMTEAHVYKTEGIGEDFIPSNYDFNVIDDMVRVSDTETMRMTRRLVREEGIFGGMSCGSAVAGAIKYCAERDLSSDKLVVVLLPDNGSRYLSKVFDDNWMRENRFLETEWADVTVATVLARKGRLELMTIGADATVGETVSKLKQMDVSQLPVVGVRGELLGVVTEVSLLNFMLMQAGQDAARRPILEAGVINSTVLTLSANTPVESVMSAFAASKVAVVVEPGDGDDKRPVGILTQIDLLDFLANR